MSARQAGCVHRQQGLVTPRRPRRSTRMPGTCHLPEDGWETGASPAPRCRGMIPTACRTPPALPVGSHPRCALHSALRMVFWGLEGGIVCLALPSTWTMQLPGMAWMRPWASWRSSMSCTKQDIAWHVHAMCTCAVHPTATNLQGLLEACWTRESKGGLHGSSSFPCTS